MAKYGRKAQATVASTMRRRKRGTLRSSSGQKVTSRRQAIAIGLSEAREKGAKVPPAPKRGRKSRRRAAGRTAAKRTGAKRSTKRTAKRRGAKRTGGSRKRAA